VSWREAQPPDFFFVVSSSALRERPRCSDQAAFSRLVSRMALSPIPLSLRLFIRPDPSGSLRQLGETPRAWLFIEVAPVFPSPLMLVSARPRLFEQPATFPPPAQLPGITARLPCNLSVPTSTDRAARRPFLLPVRSSWRTRKNTPAPRSDCFPRLPSRCSDWLAKKAATPCRQPAYLIAGEPENEYPIGRKSKHEHFRQRLR